MIAVLLYTPTGEAVEVHEDAWYGVTDGILTIYADDNDATLAAYREWAAVRVIDEDEAGEE